MKHDDTRPRSRAATSLRARGGAVIGASALPGADVRAGAAPVQGAVDAIVGADENFFHRIEGC